MSRRATLSIVAMLALLVHAAPARADGPCANGPSAFDAPTALVLSGGGAKGAWEAGLAIALIERGVPVRLVTGSSAGALNAAMIADGRLDRLEATWRAITNDGVYALRPAIAFAGLLPGWLTLLALDRAGSLLDPAPLRALLTTAIDLDRIRAAPIEVRVVAMDLARRRKRVFDNRTLTVDALMAATAVPGAFPAVEVDGQLLVDGGLTGRAPVLEALESGVAVERVLVALSYQPDELGERPSTMRRALEQAFEASMIHQIARDTELARLKFPHVDIRLVTPSAPLALRPLGFEPEGVARALALGRADGTACLREERGRARP
jgi:NTE family protein